MANLREMSKVGLKTSKGEPAYPNPTVDNNKEYAAYKKAGGQYNIQTWLKLGKPKAGAETAQLSDYGAQLEADRAAYGIYAGSGGKLPFKDWRKNVSEASEGSYWSNMGITPPDTKAAEAATDDEFVSEREQFDWQRQSGQNELDWQKVLDQFAMDKSGREEEAEAGKAAAQKEQWEKEWGIDPYEQANIDAQNASLQWQKEQAAAAAEQERQRRLAELRANPYSFVQYHQEANQPISVQPWMMPLQQGDYGWQVGQQIQSQPSDALPNLLNPSAQLWARMSPTQQGQYDSYQAASKGIPITDADWMRKSVAPPSGGAPSLSWSR